LEWELLLELVEGVVIIELRESLWGGEDEVEGDTVVFLVVVVVVGSS